MVSNLSDSFLRQFHYLRLSITDICNFRCTYCLPNGYISRGKSKSKFLSSGEIRRLINAFSDLGVEKVRLTGGEPSLRRDLVKIITVVNENSTISDIAMTTNGYRLKRDVKLWKEAGLTAINVSVDSLDARQFHAITGQDRFHQIMAGIDAAFEAGFQKVKVNTVLTRSLNNHDLCTFLDWIRTRPIQLRFIELMETGEGSSFFSSQHVSGRQVLDKLATQGWLAREKERNSGPAKVLSHPDYVGELGFIMPYSPDFCIGCNRLRVSAIGDLHLCLFSDQGIPLRDLLESDEQQGELEARISSSMSKKKASHFLHQSHTGMIQNFSYIGG